jgi:two-component system chemotaxis response regulator CheB
VNSIKRIVVVGTSSGGLQALTRLVTALPSSFTTSLFVVQHMAADATGEVLVRALARSTHLTVKHAENGELILPGRIYVAPPDQHLLIETGKVIVSKGARENISRPAIDPLFRSAAVAYGFRVIGVILTGNLNDGSAGVVAIKRCGGICIVQDPKTADYPAMPLSSMNTVKVDHCVPLDAIGPLLAKLVSGPLPKRRAIPKDITIEAKIAQRVLSDLASVNKLGKQVPFNCPDCGGVLWDITGQKPKRYRCHTGHSFTASVLLAEQTKHIEETLWVALRMFEERKNLLKTLSERRSTMPAFATERLKESDIHIGRIRAMLSATSDATTVQSKMPKRKVSGT